MKKTNIFSLFNQVFIAILSFAEYLATKCRTLKNQTYMTYNWFKFG